MSQRVIGPRRRERERESVYIYIHIYIYIFFPNNYIEEMQSGFESGAVSSELEVSHLDV